MAPDSSSASDVRGRTAVDPASPPTSDLHAALVGVLLAGIAAWLVFASSLVDWAWDGHLIVGGVNEEGAVLMSAVLGGLAAGTVGALLGVVKRRRIRWSMLASLIAGQGAALVVAAGFLVFTWTGGDWPAALLPLSIGAAAFLAVCVVGSVLLLVPRRALTA